MIDPSRLVRPRPASAAFRSSMEVGVRVDVEIIPGGERHHVASAYLVFVALDENMKPMSVPR